MSTQPFFENNDNLNRIRRTEFVEERGSIRRPKTSQKQAKLQRFGAAYPFSAMIDKENLSNISTGKAASEETTDFLLNAGISEAVQEMPLFKTAVTILADTQNQSSDKRSKHFLQNPASIKSPAHLSSSEIFFFMHYKQKLT